MLLKSLTDFRVAKNSTALISYLVWSTLQVTSKFLVDSGGFTLLLNLKLILAYGKEGLLKFFSNNIILSLTWIILRYKTIPSRVQVGMGMGMGTDTARGTLADNFEKNSVQSFA